ncbi:uncharacterized protein LOC131294650 [Anopheles ziemanni]|uniref:uncharacterized protein LOC131265247 n=1 Tax=Anopheles coustani TaxID=139045 RepID=UPI0026599415|nr:uncharacterized protein LOC131265247 [Anopheles coustani]XP_058178677.1 uncharacterized protein LOC131294650 [Anopheles ziemanni]
MVDVVLCQRLPGADGEESPKHFVGRTRRRRVTGGVSEETDPIGSEAVVECAESMEDAEDETLQQREKEPKKEDGTESQLYRCDYEQVAGVEKQVTIRIDSGDGDMMQVEVADGTVAESDPEGEPVPLDAVREQLRNLSPSTDVDELSVIEPMETVISVPNGLPAAVENCCETPGKAPETTPRTAAEIAGDEEKQHTSLMDTSRHSWHVDKETQINPTTDDLELSAIFTSNSKRQRCRAKMLLKNRQSYSITRLRPASTVTYQSNALQRQKLRLGYSVLRAYGAYLGYGDTGHIRLPVGDGSEHSVRPQEQYTSRRYPDDDEDFPMAETKGDHWDEEGHYLTPLQLRAVSSPSLSEAPIETAGTGGRSNDGHGQQLNGGANAGVVNVATVNSTVRQNHPAQQKTGGHTKASHHPVQASESVLQKFRKTFSHFKTSKTNAQQQQQQSAGVVNQHLTVSTELSNGSTTMSVEDKLHQQQHSGHQQQQQPQQQTTHHHRFGPLIWRSSKERRKTKSHRRDKCNSGDSGIQVELDNDADQHLLLQQLHPLENHPEGVSPGRNGDASHNQQYSPSGVPVRRANSAKVSTSSSASISSSILRHKLSLKSKDKENVGNISRLSGKSLSQPSGLDCIVGTTPSGDRDVDGRRRRRRQHTRTSTTVPTELDLSDSESISSHPDDEEEEHLVMTCARGDGADDRLLVEPLFAEVLFSFQPGGPQELGLEKGALVEVLKREAGPWWWGRVKCDAIVATGKGGGGDHSSKSAECGWFPKDFVKILPTYAKQKQIIIINDESSKHPPQHQHGGETTAVNEDDDGGSSASTLIEGGCDSRLVGTCDASVVGGQQEGGAASQDLTKENIIKELLETEINYVKLLNSLCMGFIKPLREREDVFSVESVNLIFSNLEKIWRFQQTFLDALRLAVPSNRIGEVFLEYQSAFMVYSSYCNSYPRALMELENYANNKEANQILENCRVAENLPELPLSAHLLAPIQRICRYPLHLSELVKHSLTRKELLPTLNLRKCTKSELETMDCREVFEMALSAMRRVTEMVNEGKRHSEYLSRVQARFENFQGPSINVHSTRLFLQTDAIRMSPNLWNNTYTLFLFDRQLIYCKKDLLKRTNYIYKGRIFLDNCRILNLPDGKMFGVTLKNALRLYCDTRNKWFDFCFRSSSSKLRFLNTLSSERQFCGESLFVSELDGGSGAASCFDDDNLSDREYFPYVDDSKELEGGGDQGLYDQVDSASSVYRASVASSNSSSVGSVYAKESLCKSTPPMMPPMVVPMGGAGGNTLPKKSRKMPKEQQQQQHQQVLAATTDYGSNSLGRRKLGNWFRKAKSTNSTPSQSPTHHPMAMSLAAIGSSNNNHSDSSSQSSLVGSQQRTLSTLGSNSALPSGTGIIAGVGKGKPLNSDQNHPASVVEAPQSQSLPTTATSVATTS